MKLYQCRCDVITTCMYTHSFCLCLLLCLSVTASSQCNDWLICHAEQSKVDLMHEMEQRAANSDQVKTLQCNIDGLTTELVDVSSKLQEAAVQLSKEKARNKAVSEHTSVSNHNSYLVCVTTYWRYYIKSKSNSKYVYFRQLKLWSFSSVHLMWHTSAVVV